MDLTYLSLSNEGVRAESGTPTGARAMDLIDVIREHFDLPANGWTDLIPAEKLSRQAWQEAVEQLTFRLRDLFRRPAFGLSESEISLHYHLPLGDFIALIKRRLGIVR